MSNLASTKARVDRERLAHSEEDVLARSYELKDRFPHIWMYPSRMRLFAVIDDHLSDLRGKRVLDYGCGRGDSSLSYAERGAVVDGIDISSAYVNDATGRASEAGYDHDCIAFHVMDAHELSFEDETFDVVVGYGILHHLDADVAMQELHRVLKPGGRLLLQEPLADNPLLRVFRLLTPKARTRDERPFSARDIMRLSGSTQWVSELSYCGLIAAPVAMLTSILVPDRPDNRLMRWADSVERWTHNHGLLLSWNQYVLLNMRKWS